MQIAKRINAYVAFGYIEKVVKDQKLIFYNSAAIIGRDGQILMNTRKTHLYFCDELWAEQGNGFKSIELKNLKGNIFKCTVAICMDIVEKKFISKEYELANYMKQNKTEVLLFLTNWNTNSQEQYHGEDQVKILKSVYSYWVHRLKPNQQYLKNKLLFLVADRIGSQQSNLQNCNCYFLGGSCAILLHDQKASVINNLGRRQERNLLIEVSLPQ